MKTIQLFFLYLYVFSINFEMWDPFGTGIDFLITKITASLFLVSTLANIRSFYTIKDNKNFFYPIVLFFLLLTYMNYRNVNASYSTFFDVPLFLNILFLFAAINFTKKSPDLLLKCLFVFSISTIILSIMYLLKFETEYSHGNRITIFGNNQNDLGIRLSISMLILNSIIQDNKIHLGKTRYLLYSFFPLMITFLVETGSRVAFISLLLGYFMYAYLRKSRNFIRKLLTISLTVILMVFIWQVLLKDSFLSERLFASAKEGDLSGRELRWIAALEIFINNPLFGIGETGYSNEIEFRVGYYTSPHNVFLEIICYTGIVGFLLFLTFFIKIIKTSYLSFKSDLDILPVILVIPIFGTMLSGQMLGVKIIWIIFTYIISKNNNLYFNAAPATFK